MCLSSFLLRSSLHGPEHQLLGQFCSHGLFLASNSVISFITLPYVGRMLLLKDLASPSCMHRLTMRAPFAPLKGFRSTTILLLWERVNAFHRKSEGLVRKPSLTVLMDDLQVYQNQSFLTTSFTSCPRVGVCTPFSSRRMQQVRSLAWIIVYPSYKSNANES